MESLPAAASFLDRGLTPVFYPADEAEQPLAVMPVTPEQHRQRHIRWINSPRARLDSRLQQRLTATTSFTSVSNLSKIPNYNERSQGYAGNCWVWGCTAAMEGEYYNQFGSTSRISIQYVDSNYMGPWGWAGCGSDIPYFVEFYDSKKMCIPWSNTNAHYQDYYRTCADGTAVPASAISTTPRYTITSIEGNGMDTFEVGQATAIANIKNVINQGKVPVFCFFLPDSGWASFREFWNMQTESTLWSNFYDGAYANKGHAVACVGYNDDDPNPENHYWIMLNSWGTNGYRPSGLFRVKMYYDYDSASSYGWAMTEWWTIDTVFLVSPPPAPTLTSPSSGTYVSSTSIPFTWSSTAGATAYWLTARKVSDGTFVINQPVGNVTTYNVNGFPNNGAEYKWAAAAGNNAGWTAAAYQPFINGPLARPAAPVLTYPAGGAAAGGASISFQWNASTGATGYWLTVQKISDGSYIINQMVGNVTGFIVTGFPNDGTQYRWAVGAGNSAGWTASAYRSFTSGTATRPAAPPLTYPVPGATVSGTGITFTWSAPVGATAYWLTVQKVSDGSHIINQPVGDVTSRTVTGFPNDGTQYRWAVAAGNSAGWTAAAFQSFTSGP